MPRIPQIGGAAPIQPTLVPPARGVGTAVAGLGGALAEGLQQIADRQSELDNQNEFLEAGADITRWFNEYRLRSEEGGDTEQAAKDFRPTAEQFVTDRLSRVSDPDVRFRLELRAADRLERDNVVYQESSIAAKQARSVDALNQGLTEDQHAFVFAETPEAREAVKRSAYVNIALMGADAGLSDIDIGKSQRSWLSDTLDAYAGKAILADPAEAHRELSDPESDIFRGMDTKRRVEAIARAGAAAQNAERRREAEAKSALAAEQKAEAKIVNKERARLRAIIEVSADEATIETAEDVISQASDFLDIDVINGDQLVSIVRRVNKAVREDGKIRIDDAFLGRLLAGKVVGPVDTNATWYKAAVDRYGEAISGPLFDEAKKAIGGELTPDDSVAFNSRMGTVAGNVTRMGTWPTSLMSRMADFTDSADPERLAFTSMMFKAVENKGIRGRAANDRSFATSKVTLGLIETTLSLQRGGAPWRDAAERAMKIHSQPESVLDIREKRLRDGDGPQKSAEAFEDFLDDTNFFWDPVSTDIVEGAYLDSYRENFRSEGTHEVAQKLTDHDMRLRFGGSEVGTGGVDTLVGFPPERYYGVSGVDNPKWMNQQLVDVYSAATGLEVGSDELRIEPYLPTLGAAHPQYLVSVVDEDSGAPFPVFRRDGNPLVMRFDFSESSMARDNISLRDELRASFDARTENAFEFVLPDDYFNSPEGIAITEGDDAERNELEFLWPGVSDVSR